MDIGEIDLTHLRVSKTGEHNMSLDPEGAQTLAGLADKSGGVGKDPEKMLLSELIDEFNERYGAGMSAADKVQFEERIVAAADDPDLQEAAVASRNEGDFELPFDSRFRDIMVERAEADTTFTEKFFSDAEFSGRLTRAARRAAYQMIRRRAGLIDAA
jgi:type I restriction enzyme R subunit